MHERGKHYWSLIKPHWERISFNNTGVLAPEAEEAFEAIGLPELAQTVRRATAICGGLPMAAERYARRDESGAASDR